MIKRFVIKKLFGFRKVDIRFQDNIKILVGENGLGKTTILNTLYYLLTQKYSKLVQIEFDEIILEFENKVKIQFSKDELMSFLHYQERGSHSSLRNRLKKSVDLSELKQKVDKLNRNEEVTKTIEDFLEHTPQLRRYAPTNILIRELFAIISEPELNKFIQISNVLKNTIGDILYFPTYRRVEEELQNLGELKRFHQQREFINEYDELVIEEEKMPESDDILIHFGMEDVENRIRNIESEIKKSSVIGFSRVTAEMLSQLLKGFSEVKDKDIESLDINTVRIVVHRVGQYLSQRDKEHILSLLNNFDQLRKKKELVYFIIKLIDIYNQHKHLDDAIKNFRDVCNKYLVDKEFRYNESAVELNIYRNKTEDIVHLNKLSSGEKQIVSLFSKLYFESYNKLLILFDEPELSLSIEWQANLLPDIVKSHKCNFLLTVTHSPFIFKNELDQYAVGMNLYIK